MKVVLHLLALVSALTLFAWSVFLDTWMAFTAQGVAFLLCLTVVASNVYALMQLRTRGQ